MTTSTAYDPERPLSPEDWLELDEQERISLAKQFHVRARIELPSVDAHAVFHAIVENQIALGLGPVVRAMSRLMKQGLTRHDSIHAVASVLADHLYEQANMTSEDSADVLQARYDAAVERLNAKDWCAKYGASDA